MIGRGSWRRNAVSLLVLATLTGVLFTLAASSPQAGLGIVTRLRDSLRSGVQGFSRHGFGQSRQPTAAGAVIRAESPERMARHQMDLALKPHLLRLTDYDFDPRTDNPVPPDALSELVAPHDSVVPPQLAGGGSADVSYYIVQYAGPPTPIRKAIEAAGAQVADPMANSSYLVRASADQLARILAQPMVIWHGPWLDAYKVTGAVTRMVAAADSSQLPLDNKGYVRLSLRFFRDADWQPYEELVKGIPGVTELAGQQPLGAAFASIIVGVQPDALRQAVVSLATLRDVFLIYDNQPPHVYNDQSVWFVQTGIDAPGATNYDVTAKLFLKGIDGHGMIGGVADNGLENDLCYFRYGADVNEACWPLGPCCTGGTCGPLPAEGGDIPPYPAVPPTRTRARKVVAYYLEQGADAYSEGSGQDAQHGTVVTGCMAGDSHTATGWLADRPLIRDVGRLQNLPPYQASGTWVLGQDLRPDLISQTQAYDPATGGAVHSGPGTTPLVQHHQARDGMAPGAQVVFQDVGAHNNPNITGLYTAQQLYGQAHDTGATVHNVSFGGGGCSSCYDSDAPPADDALFYYRDLVGVVAAGNDGIRVGAASIGQGFAHGKNELAAGALIHADQNSGNSDPRPGESVETYSSKGPKSGGLMGPDLTAPGDVYSACDNQLPSQPETGQNDGTSDCGEVTVLQETGTSFASPTTAGEALLVEQYFMDGYYPSGAKTRGKAGSDDSFRPTNALVRAVLVNSCRNLKGGNTGSINGTIGDRPNFGQGWGAPRLDDTLYFQGDPTVGVDPKGDHDRAKLLVLADTPNGYAIGVTPASVGGCSTWPLTVPSPEPGGKTRDQIAPLTAQGALTDGAEQQVTLNVINPDPTAAANELRITMAYDAPAGSTTPVNNDLDLEVVSPSGRIYRPNPLANWSGGYTQPSTDTRQQTLAKPFLNPTDNSRDPLNTIENVFISSDQVESGAYIIRVIAYTVNTGGSTTGYPNFVNGDRGCDLDTNGDGVNDQDSTDLVQANKQGYALIVSGNFTTTQGLLALNHSQFDCTGGNLILTLTDANGDAPRTGCSPNGVPLSATPDATVTTTSSSVAFPTDLEDVPLVGTQPSYTSASLPVVVTSDPTRVIHGDGKIEVGVGQQIVATYVDGNPCGGTSVARASVACTPALSDNGFQIQDGCDYAVPGDPTSGVRPDAFMDAGETNRYTAFFVNNGATDLHDVYATLQPDPTDPYAGLVTVLQNPRYVGLAPPGRISNAVFYVQIDPAMSAHPRHQMAFNVCYTSPADGLFTPQCFTQQQVLEADLQSFRYDTRDPNGELFGRGRIARSRPGAPDPPVANADFIVNAPMWFDPDADCGGQPCSAVCNIPRDQWPDANTVPPQCASVQNLNPVNPWDFDDSDEGFLPATYAGDTNQITDWVWKSGATGGGCGFENELDDQLVNLPAGHPDKSPTPWGIWHTGPINPTQNGPIPNATTPAPQGVPYKDDEGQTDDHSILWDSRPTLGANGVDNSTGQWCTPYISRASAFSGYYRNFLIPPDLHRVHGSADFKTEFQELRVYTRLDGHTIDGQDTAVAGWMVNNQQVLPSSATPLRYTWAQYQYGTLIYTDHVQPDWSARDSFLSVDLHSPNSDFPYLTYEDIYGPEADTWSFSLTWGQFAQTPRYDTAGHYGWGVDDTEFIWTESREVDDTSDCTQLVPSGQPALVFFDSQRYNACEGTVHVTLIDPSQAANTLAVCVTSSAEHYDTCVLTRTTGDRFEGAMPFSVDPRQNVPGTLLVSAGSIDIGNGADTINVEYDPQHSTDWNPSDPGFSQQQSCDWQDTTPADGVNDDNLTNSTAGPPSTWVAPADGIPDAEDDWLKQWERDDSATINCTSGRIYYIKHRLLQVGAGDNDRFADHGETQLLSVQLFSALSFDLEDVTVTIQTTDDTVCIENDSVHLDKLAAGMTTDTPLDLAATDPQLQGFRFAVPLAVVSTLANPQTVSFRINVRGRNAQTQNEFSTQGDGYNSFLPTVAKLYLDLDAVSPYAADFLDGTAPSGAPYHNVLPPTGEFLEDFEKADSPGIDGFDHADGSPNTLHMQRRQLDATTDTRFHVDTNGGFCPECSYLTQCRVPQDCAWQFTPAGTNPYPNPSEWNRTDQWVKTGQYAYKFGKSGTNSGCSAADQHYLKGQFTCLELPPLKLSNDPSVTPTLKFWHIADFWVPFFTSGLITPVGAGVVEISPTLVGATNRTSDAAIQTKYPTSRFERLYPVQGGYDNETDALNACHTFFCRYKHPVFASQGSTCTQASDPAQRGANGQATWVESTVDLSDYRGMEVVVRFTVEVLQDLTIQAGHFGWIVDDVRVDGAHAAAVSDTSTAFRVQADQSLIVDPCGLTAAFASSSPDCYGDYVQLFDRHTGTGTWGGTPPAPLPLQFEWHVGSVVIGPGDPGTAIRPAPAGVDSTSTYDNPRINLKAAGLGAGIYQVTEIIHQGASTTQAQQTVVYKDAPVPAIAGPTTGYAGASERFSSTVTVDPTIDPTRTYIYAWDFGDGTPLDTSGSTVSHVFATPGTYAVNLTVTDEDGCVGTTATAHSITISTGPTFGSPTATFVRDCGAADPATPDGNADLDEYVTLNVGFKNTGTIDATGTIGYLSSSDPNVEITDGTASYGTVARGGGNAAPQPFQFIRHPVTGQTLGCLTVPFTLTLVSNGGTLVQTVDFAYTMGVATDVPYGPQNPGPQTFSLGDQAPSPPAGSFTGVPTGCLDGLELTMTITGTHQATMDHIAIDIISPDLIAHHVMYRNTGSGTSLSMTVDFAFGNDADAPIRDTGGKVDDRAGTLDPAVAAGLISDLTGTAMAGTWVVNVYDASGVPQQFTSQYTVDISVFSLEGQNSTGLQINTHYQPGDCGTCIVGAPPVFTGVADQCLGTAGTAGLITWSPAADVSRCGADSLTYDIYSSTTAGTRGSQVTPLAQGQTCANCPPAANGNCALYRDPIATEWEVCDVSDYFWTVVARDTTPTQPAGGPEETPPTSATGAALAPYQTPEISCVQPPTGGPIRIVKTGSGLTSDLSVIVVDPTAAEFRIYRGTFPNSAAGLNRPLVLGTRAAGADWPYDHSVLTPPGCGGTPVGTALVLPGGASYVDGTKNWYYLTPSVNGAGCSGLGHQGKAPVSSGQPEQSGAGIPVHDASCGACGP